MLLAVDPGRGRVAIKLLLGSNPAQRRRFQTEVKVLARLHHPNLVRVHAAGEHRGGRPPGRSARRLGEVDPVLETIREGPEKITGE